MIAPGGIYCLTINGQGWRGLHRERWGVDMLGHWIIWLWHYRTGTWGFRYTGWWHCHVRTQDTGLLDCDSYFGTWALSFVRHYRTPIPKWNNMFATSWTGEAQPSPLGHKLLSYCLVFGIINDCPLLADRSLHTVPPLDVYSSAHIIHWWEL